MFCRLTRSNDQLGYQWIQTTVERVLLQAVKCSSLHSHTCPVQQSSERNGTELLMSPVCLLLSSSLSAACSLSIQNFLYFHDFFIQISKWRSVVWWLVPAMWNAVSGVLHRHFRSSDCIHFQSLTTYHSHFDFCFGCLAINPSPSRTLCVFKSSCTTGSSCTGCKYSIPWTTPWVRLLRHNFFDVNRFILLDEIFKIFVRNVFQDNAVVLWLENHRIQLHSVGVVQFVWHLPGVPAHPEMNTAVSSLYATVSQSGCFAQYTMPNLPAAIFFPPSSAHCTVSLVRPGWMTDYHIRQHLILASCFLHISFLCWFCSVYVAVQSCSVHPDTCPTENLSNWTLVLRLSTDSSFLFCSNDVISSQLLLLLLLHPFNGLSSRTTWVNWHQKGKPFWILLEQEMIGWQWHQLDHMHIICTSLKTDNH